MHHLVDQYIAYNRSLLKSAIQNRTKKRSYDDYCPFSEQSSKSRKLTPTEGKKQPGDFIQHKVIIDLTQSSDDEDGIIVHYDD